MTDPSGTSNESETVVLLRAIAAMAAEIREHDESRTSEKKTEMLLADVGMTNEQIAVLLGKKPDTVRKAIERARGTQSGRN